MKSLDLMKLVRKAWLIVLAMVIGGTAAMAYGLSQPTVYESYAQLMVGPGIDSPNPDLNVLRAGGQLIQTYAELPLTEPFLSDIIFQLELNLTPKELAALIDIRPNQETQILSIKVKHEDETLSAEIALMIADKLVRLSPSNPASQAARLKEEVRAQAAELEQMISDTKNSIRQLEQDTQSFAELSLTGSSAESNAVINQQLMMYEQSSDRLSEASAQNVLGVQILTQLIANATNRITLFEQDLQKASNTTTQTLVSDQIRAERNHLSSLQSALAEIKRPYQGIPLDQYISDSQARLEKLEENLDRISLSDLRKLQFDRIVEEQDKLSIARQIEGDRYKLILSQIANERGRISEIELAQIGKQKQVQDQISIERSRLSDLQKTLALVYSSMQEAEPNQVQIIEVSSIPVEVTPSLPLFLLVGALAGGVLATVGVLTLELLNSNIETSEQVQAIVAAPTVEIDKNTSMLVNLLQKKKVRRERIQNYQMLVMHLLYSKTEGEKKLIVVGGTDPSASGGVVAASLALAFAQTGKRVIVIDANADEPVIAPYFNLGMREGLSESLANPTKKYLPMASMDRYPDLGILPFGSAPVEMNYLSTPRMLMQLERLKERADFVLVSVPNLQKPDSVMFAANADGVILVVTKDKTTEQMLEEVVGNLGIVDVEVLAVVLKNNRSSEVGLDWLRSRATAYASGITIEKPDSTPGAPVMK